MVDFDQPALIEGVLQVSGKEKLIYIGHSQGSAQLVLGLGVHQHLSHKIAAFIGLGTVVSLEGVNDHVVLKAVDKLKLLELCNLLGLKRLLIFSQMLSRAIGILVYNSKFHFEFVMIAIRMLCGMSKKNKISSEYFGVMLTQ